MTLRSIVALRFGNGVNESKEYIGNEFPEKGTPATNNWDFRGFGILPNGLVKKLRHRAKVMSLNGK